MAEERESFESQWAPSDVIEENLKEMVVHGILPAKEIIGWRPAFGEAFPTPDTHKVVVFSHFFYGGFSLPTSRFFRGILNFYGISLHHLNPNSIVHIANFIQAYEAFLGIRPHFALFCRIFFLKPQPNKSKPCVVGGAGFQLKGTLSQKYFSMPFKTSNKGWHANWFYVQNPETALPEYSCLPPVYQDTWNSLPMGDEAAQAVELMERMLKLKEQGLQGEQITRHFIKSRLAPIKERSRMAFEFDGKHDPNREGPDSLDFKVMKERMYKIFSNTIVVSYSHLLPVMPYNAFNPPPPEFALMKSDPPIAQRRSPRHQTGQGSGGPKIRSEAQPNTSNPAGQSDSRKRKLVLSDDEGDDAKKPGDRETTRKLPKQAIPKKKTSSRPMPKIRKSSRNKAKTATLEQLVPHLGNLEAVRDQLHEAKELAKKTEHDLRDRIAQLQESNFELSGSSKVSAVQAAKMSQLEKQIQTLESDKAELARQRDSALKEVEDRKIKSQAQFDVLVGKIKRLEGARDEVANAATPLVQAMFFNNNGPSTFDASEIFDKLRVAPDTYFKNIKEAGSMGASLALAMTKSLYPKIDIDAVDGFVNGTSEEAALDLINDAQKAADKIAVDVVERVQDTDLQPTGPDGSDDEKTDTD
uniref:Retrotransposon protein, putative, unclassified n=1 Tax=Oryza sativa subsp. japonica TaxID=39947 RepID=Q2QSM0_ORYSJ|nr:retrotransposon protein, putative, unclassified [Oryza sativa Japonica Group]